MRLRAVLLEIAPEMLHRSWEGPQPESKAMIYLLQRWPGFEGMERAQLRSIEKILHRCRYGGKATKVAMLLREAARRISMAVEERAAITLEMSLLVQQMAVCDASLDRLFEEIQHRVESHPVGLKLLEVHGIGPVVAGTRFRSCCVARTATEAQCATYAGVTPIGRKSGKWRDTSTSPAASTSESARFLHLCSGRREAQCGDRAYYRKKLGDYAGHPKPHAPRSSHSRASGTSSSSS